MAIRWDIDLKDLKLGDVIIETNTGTMRSGRITKINMVEQVIMGKKVKRPGSIEMNGEQSDFIDWGNIVRIERKS